MGKLFQEFSQACSVWWVFTGGSSRASTRLIWRRLGPCLTRWRY